MLAIVCVILTALFLVREYRNGVREVKNVRDEHHEFVMRTFLTISDCPNKVRVALGNLKDSIRSFLLQPTEENKKKVLSAYKWLRKNRYWREHINSKFVRDYLKYLWRICPVEEEA